MLSAGLLVWVWVAIAHATRGIENRGRESDLGTVPDSPIPDSQQRPVGYRGLLAVLSHRCTALNPHDLTLLIFPAWIITSYIAGRQDSPVNPVVDYPQRTGCVLATLSDPWPSLLPACVITMSLSVILLARNLFTRADAR